MFRNNNNWGNNSNGGRGNDFGRSNGYGNNNLMSLMDINMSGYSGPSGSGNFNNNQMSARPGYQNNKTPEQMAFESEFEKWERSFSDWKLTNQNHPNPDQYKFYEGKFLDVRDKLLEKRRELFSPNVAPIQDRFNNHLGAADAMANSILTRFSDDCSASPSNYGNGRGYQRNDNFGPGTQRNNNFGPRTERNNNFGPGTQRNNNFGPKTEKNNNFGSGTQKNNNFGSKTEKSNNFGPKTEKNNNFGQKTEKNNNFSPKTENNNNFGSGSQKNNPGTSTATTLNIQDELSRLGSDPQNKWILSVLTKAIESNQKQPQQEESKPQPSQPKKAVNSNKTSRWSTNSKGNVKNVNKIKKPSLVAKPFRSDSSVPYYDRLDAIIEEAQKVECPKLLSGAGSKRLRAVREKKPEDLTLDEMKLIRFSDYLTAKRAEYYARVDNEKALEAANNDQVMTVDTA